MGGEFLDVVSCDLINYELLNETGMNIKKNFATIIEINLVLGADTIRIPPRPRGGWYLGS